MQNLRVVLDAQWMLGEWQWNLRVTDDGHDTPILMAVVAGGAVAVAEREGPLDEAHAVLSAVVRQIAGWDPLPGVG